MDLAAKIMWEKKVCEDSEGAVIVDLTKHSKKLGKAVVKKKDGTSLYLTRDIGAAIERVEKYHFEYDALLVYHESTLLIHSQPYDLCRRVTTRPTLGPTLQDRRTHGQERHFR
jgi:hypothetical protein